MNNIKVLSKIGIYKGSFIIDVLGRISKIIHIDDLIHVQMLDNNSTVFYYWDIHTLRKATDKEVANVLARKISGI